MVEGGSAEGAVLPLPRFYFSVDLGDGQALSFSEVSGLEIVSGTIEYQHGDNAVFSSATMPRLSSTGHITLKKGVVSKGSALSNCFQRIDINVVKSRTIIIDLRDEMGAAAMTWTLSNAFPVKIQASGSDSDDREVAIETLEITYETLAVKAA